MINVKGQDDQVRKCDFSDFLVRVPEYKTLASGVTYDVM